MAGLEGNPTGNGWAHLAEVLRRLGEAAAGTRGASVGKPENVLVRQQAEAKAKRIADGMKAKATELVQASTGKDSKQKTEHRELEKNNKYQNADLDASKNSIKKAQGEDLTAATPVLADITKTPTELQSIPVDGITVPAVGEFIATLTHISETPALRDPNIVYGEVSKLYRSIDWNSVSNETAKISQIRKAIDGGLAYAERLVSEAGAPHDGVIDVMVNEKNNARYVLEQGINDQDSFDLYRSRRVEVPKKQLGTNQNDNRTITAYNAEITKLQRALKVSQDELDVVGRNLNQEKQILRDAKQKVKYAMNSQKNDDIVEVAGEYNELITRRLNEIDIIEEAQRVGRSEFGRGKKPNIEAAKKLTQIEQDDLLRKIPASLRDEAKKIFDVYDMSAPTAEELQRIREEVLAKLNVRTKVVEDFIKNKLPPGLTDEELYIKLGELRRDYGKQFDALQSIIDDRLRILVGEEGYGRAYFGLHPEHARFLKDIDLQGKTIATLPESDKRTLYKIAHGIMDRAEDNPRAQFREGMDLYTSDNWKEFISTLKDKADLANWNPAEIDEFTNLFTGVREMREMVHDLDFVSNFAGLEILNKFTSNTLAGDLDAWIRYTPTMRYAYALRAGILDNIISQNNGNLPPALCDKKMFEQTFLDRLCEQQMEEAIKSGAFEELRELSEQYNTPSDDPKQPEKNKHLALKEGHRALKVAKAFGTITLDSAMQMSTAKVPGNFTSGPENNLIQDVDPMRHLLIKYGLGKDGRARFYAALTHDDVGAKQILTMTDAEVEKFFYERETHPEYGKSIAEFRNFFKMADRFGDGKSFWGLIEGMKDWPEEMKAVRGAGLKLHDAVARAARELRNEYAGEIDRKFGAGASADVRHDVEQWWSGRVHDADVHHRFQHLLEHNINTAFNELTVKSPGVLIDRAAKDVGYESLPFDALEQTLSESSPDLLKSILEKDDGSPLVITRGGHDVTIRSLHDLWMVSTSNVPGNELDVGIPLEMKADLDRRLSLFNSLSYQIKGDLAMVEQAVYEKFWLGAEGDLANGIRFDEHMFHDEHLKLSLLGDHIESVLNRGVNVLNENGSSLGALEAADRQTLVENYIKAIHDVTSREVTYKYHGNDQVRPAFKDYLKKKFIEGSEHNVITKRDIPLNRIKYGHWGSSVVSRTIGDALNVRTGVLGFWDFLNQLNGHVEPEDIYKVLSEKCLTPLTSADPDLAKNIGGFAWDTALYLYRESDLATNMGIFGRAMTSEFVIETAESISKTLGFRGNIPRWMFGSRSQQLIDPGATRLSADDVWKWTRFAAEMNMLPKDHHPMGWAKTSYTPTSYTKGALRNRYHGNPINVLPQAIMTGMPIATALIIWQALNEKEEGGGGGHH